MPNNFLKTLRNKKGQTATEYMLIVAVVVIGLVMIAKAVFLPKFNSGVEQLAQSVETKLSEESN